MRALPLIGLPFAVLVLLEGPAAANDTPSPSPSPTSTVSTAGTSFLTAVAVEPGQEAKVSASTGDYLYWSFTSKAGQTDEVTVNVTLPPAASRHGGATWTADVFDGLRRRQACTAGPQTSSAAADGTTVALHCTLRRTRAWADPWSDEPLPGTYYLRLSATGIPEQDLGLSIEADMNLTVKDGPAQPDNANLKAPLSPAASPGTTVAPDASPTATPKAIEKAESWFSWPSTRWYWTVGGGILAAVLGVAGYSLTRHPRRWFS